MSQSSEFRVVCAAMVCWSPSLAGDAALSARGFEGSNQGRFKIRLLTSFYVVSKVELWDSELEMRLTIEQKQWNKIDNIELECNAMWLVMCLICLIRTGWCGPNVNSQMYVHDVPFRIIQDAHICGLRNPYPNILSQQWWKQSSWIMRHGYSWSNHCQPWVTIRLAMVHHG